MPTPEQSVCAVQPRFDLDVNKEVINYFRVELIICQMSFLSSLGDIYYLFKNPIDNFVSIFIRFLFKQSWTICFTFNYAIIASIIHDINVTYALGILNSKSSIFNLKL